MRPNLIAEVLRGERRERPPVPPGHGGSRRMSTEEIPDALRSSKAATLAEMIQVAATILALIQVGRGQLASEAEERLAVLERAVFAEAVRGELDVWDLELLDAADFSTPARGLVWLCVRRAVHELGAELRTARVDGLGIVRARRPWRARPWDVVRHLVTTVPRIRRPREESPAATLASALQVDPEVGTFGAWLREAQEEIDLAERAPRTRGSIDRLLVEHRTRAARAELLPVFAAIDAGAPLPDPAARLRAAAARFDDLEPVSSKRAAA